MPDSVFRKGDVVYHTYYGKCSVEHVEGNINTRIHIKPEESFATWPVAEKELSFSPWPAPNHERPFTEVGWWARRCGYQIDVRWRINEREYRVEPDGANHVQSNPDAWIKFLGTEL